jgi:hypothetical protein
MHHVFLDACNDPTAKQEIEESKRWVEQMTGKPCTMFCPPGGKFDARRLAQISAAGFIAIRTVEMISVARPVAGDKLLIMPTTLQAHPHTPATYLRNVLKRRGRNLWLYLMRGRTPDWTTLAERLIRTAIARCGVFHLWGHSWEIEESSQWSKLEDVMKMMCEQRSTAPCVTNSQIVQQLRTAA